MLGFLLVVAQVERLILFLNVNFNQDVYASMNAPRKRNYNKL